MNSLIQYQCILFFCLIWPITGYSNIPAAYFACEGAENGDSCQLPGPTYGNCVLDTLCEDPQETGVNECLLCVDGCWGMEPDSFCIQQDGSDGVCQAQEQCTTDPEKSFDQCNWCVGGDIPRTAAAEGCNQTPINGGWLWVLIAVGLVRERGRS